MIVFIYKLLKNPGFRRYLQLSDTPVSSCVLELVYASLAIFWGGAFLCVTSFHASGANDDFQAAILDLMWRKQEMVASHASDVVMHSTPADIAKEKIGADGAGAGREAAAANPGRQQMLVMESSTAIDAAVGICRWGHESEGLSVFGIRWGRQVLTSVAVVTAGQVVLFSQLILRHYGLAASA